MSTFALDIGRFARKFGINAHTAARKFMLDVQADVMKATPVKTGLLRSSWFVNLGTPSNEVAATPNGGSVARSQAASTLAGWAWGQTVYISNNLPYAYAIEFLGHSKIQAPAGMLRTTVARYQAQFGRWS